MNIVIDSSVFVSHIGLKDENSDPSKVFFIALTKIRPKIILPSIVVAEIITVLSQQKHRQLTQVLNGLKDFDIIPLDAKFIAELTRLVTSTEILLKTSDLIIAITAKIYNAILVSWDKKLIKNIKKLCSIATPTELIMQINNLSAN